MPGRLTPPAPARTGPGYTPGPGFGYYPKTTPTPGCTICSSAATTTPANPPTYAATHPRPVPLRTLVTVAGQRWRIEESFQAAKGLTGLDQHQVRRWTSWHRWTILAMLAHAFLAVACAAEGDTAPSPVGLITLTVNEFRRLFDALLLATNQTITSLLAWSRW